MSSGTQVDMDWVGADVAGGGAGAPAAAAPDTGAGGPAYLTDEEILGIEPVNAGAPNQQSVTSSGERNHSSTDDARKRDVQRDSSGKDDPQNDNVRDIATRGAMPEWMRTLAADPRHGGEAQTLWREHQEFRAAFASPEEARAVKELLPGGVRDVLSLREATQSVERIDAALFSGDARAQSEVVAELARAYPVAFRAMFAEAAKVLAGMGARGDEVRAGEAGSREPGGREARNFEGSIANGLNGGRNLQPGSGQGQERQESQIGRGRTNRKLRITLR